MKATSDSSHRRTQRVPDPTFSRARGKLQNAHAAIDILKRCSDTLSFRAQFNATCNALRAITYALQRDGKHVGGFAEWYEPKQAEMRDDDLLRFVHDARIADLHEAREPVRAHSMYVNYFSTEDAGSPPVPGAALQLNADGIYWVANPGTARERRWPVRAGSFTIKLTLAKPPRTHRGQSVAGDPIGVCQLALTYFEELVDEAINTFAASATGG